jgi:hypothetical protein
MQTDAQTAYFVAPYRYAKNSVVVRCPSPDGYKTRASRLIGDGLRGRYSGRAGGYVVSPTKAAKFERLYAEGWDANGFSGELQSPRVQP